MEKKVIKIIVLIGCLSSLIFAEPSLKETENFIIKYYKKNDKQNYESYKFNGCEFVITDTGYINSSVPQTIVSYKPFCKANSVNIDYRARYDDYALVGEFNNDVIKQKTFFKDENRNPEVYKENNILFYIGRKAQVEKFKKAIMHLRKLHGIKEKGDIF